MWRAGCSGSAWNSGTHPETATDDATNTAHNFVAGDYIGSEYRTAVFSDSLNIGQAFTTGANAGGYLLNSISIQVSWGPTDWDFDGGSVTLRVFDISGGLSPAVEIAFETVAAPAAATSPTLGGTPTPMGKRADWRTSSAPTRANRARGSAR